MRIGILGYGYMGTIRHRELGRRADCRVTRIFHTGDCPHHADSWRAVATDPDIDGVFVCLPNDLTCTAVCTALSAGKHVFAEKPPGTTPAEVERMARAQAASGRVLKFGFNHRLHPGFRALQAQARDLGEVLWARGIYGKPFADDFAAGWRADPARAGGGILLDQGIHMLDLLRVVCGGFDEVRAFSQRSRSQDVEDEVVALLRSPSGAVATLASSHTQWKPTFSLEVGLTDGWLHLHGLLSRSGRYGPETLELLRRGERAVSTWTFGDDDSWALEIAEWVAAVRGEQPVTVGSTAEARDLMDLLHALYRAAGRPVGLHRPLPG